MEVEFVHRTKGMEQLKNTSRSDFVPGQTTLVRFAAAGDVPIPIPNTLFDALFTEEVSRGGADGDEGV